MVMSMKERRNLFTDTANFIAETDMLSFWPQNDLKWRNKITLEWPQINPVDPKCQLVLCGMIFLKSGPNMKTISPPEQQILQVM